MEWIFQVEPWWVGNLHTNFPLKSCFFPSSSSSNPHESWETFSCWIWGGCFYVYKGVSIRVVFVGGCGLSMKLRKNKIGFWMVKWLFTFFYSILLRKLVCISFLKVSELSYFFSIIVLLICCTKNCNWSPKVHWKNWTQF